MRRMKCSFRELNPSHSNKKKKANHPFRRLPLQMATGRPPFGERPVGTIRFTRTATRSNQRAGGSVDEKTAFSPSCLWADADPILNHIERFLRHDILGDQFTLHLVRPIADDPFRDL